MGKHSVKVEKETKVKEEKVGKEKNKKNKNGKKKHRLLKAFLIFLLIVILILGVFAGVAWWYLNDKLNKVQYEEIEKTKIGISEEVKEE